MVPSKLLRHIETNHREQMNNPISYFENIRSSFQKQSKKFKKFMTTSDEAQTDSYMIAQLIARKKKAHAEAEEIILPALKIVAECMLTNDAMEKVTKIPLSSKTIARRIEDMSEDIELQIKQSFNDSSTKWAIQLDETTDISNKAQLLAFLRIINMEISVDPFLLFDPSSETRTGSIVQESGAAMDVTKARAVSGKIRCSANLRLLEGEDGFKTQYLKDPGPHLGSELRKREPEDEISLTTCGLVDPLFSENKVKLVAFKFGNRKSPGPDGIDNTVVKALNRVSGKDPGTPFYIILIINISKRMIETRSGKMQDPAQERIMPEESAKPQPGATIGRDASSDPVVLNPNIDIPKFDGTEDPRPWIESLEEIGFLYHWADYIISRYAAMNMIGSAKTWLNLHKISFTSWENFKSRLIQDFASDANKEEMKMRLNRMQQWNEPAIRFAEDILVLCNKVDPQMEEETKINWVIGGLKKEYSFALHLNPPKNTNELLEICKKLDLFEKNYQERAEKSKALYNGPRSPRPHHQEQWKNATSFRRPYQNTSKPQAPAPRYYQNTSKPQAPTPRYYQNKPLPQVSAPRRSYTPNPEPKPVYPSKTYNKNPNSNRNRTEDGRPICFKCNKPGHVARYCRVRFVRIVEEDPIVTQDKVEEEIRMDNGTQKSRPLLYADVSNSPYSSIPTRNRYAALEDLN
ncbi:FAM200A [Cordylochernes scorpioides]|uniref:FAM200A n=1 Tax=Cordylochernes scorpioides TaxID=51811 RepID=A0ABY6LW90_9ARAC|nr:FAM200A [Cordylochernes scorpioides]